MQRLTVRRCLITSAAVVILSGIALFGVDLFGRGSRVVGPVGTIQARNIVRRVVDDPVDAYRFWKNAGYRGRTIVSVTDRWESFDPGEIFPVQMFRDYPLQLYNSAKLVEETRLTGVTFLYAAALNRICREIVAILPGGEVERLGALARRSKDFRISGQAVFSSRQGFPRWFVTGAGFTGVDEPVLLYVGASYFRSAEPEELFRQLIAAGLRTDCVILCRETGKETVTPREMARLDRFARLIGIPEPAERGGRS